MEGYGGVAVAQEITQVTHKSEGWWFCSSLHAKY